MTQRFFWLFRRAAASKRKKGKNKRKGEIRSLKDKRKGLKLDLFIVILRDPA